VFFRRHDRVVLRLSAVAWVGVITACGPGAAPNQTLQTIGLDLAPPATPAKAERPMVLLGDSLADQSRDALVAANPRLTVDAFPGRTVAEPLLADTGTARVADLAQLNPAWWIVELGTNDAAFALRPIDEMRADIVELLDTIGREACIAWVLPAVTSPVSPAAIDLTNGFGLVAADEVGRLPCHAIIHWSETVSSESNLLDPDGVHFTDHGEERFATVLADAITRFPPVP
jgi:lysophospholipase L1-like esterase